MYRLRSGKEYEYLGTGVRTSYNNAYHQYVDDYYPVLSKMPHSIAHLIIWTLPQQSYGQYFTVEFREK